MRIYLTGFMGAGKTTVGRILSADLSSSFVDLDQEIEQSTGRSIAEIIQNSGEQSFRRLETRHLESLLSTNIVVSTGGGCFLFNRDWMLTNGTVVYLDVPFATLAGRIGADPARPLWRNAEQLFRDREPAYRAAHLIVDGSLPPQEVAREIRERLSTR